MGVKDMFAVLLMVKYLLSDVGLFDDLKLDIAHSLVKLEYELATSSIQEVKHMMGFQSNWQAY